MKQTTYIIGRLTKDPEIRVSQQGISIAKFSVAVNNYDKSTTFFRCVAFDKLADTIGKYGVKGQLVSVDGQIKTSEYEKEGTKVSSWELVVRNYLMLGRKEETSKVSDIAEQFEGSIVDEDSIPF